MAVKFLNDVTVDSSVLYVDTTNDRVGINQTSPIGAVHILGPNTNPAMTTSALVVEQGDGAKILIDGNDIDAAAGMLYLNDYSTNDVVFGGQIRVGGGGSPVGNSWFANGNVGIGTTNPGAKLHVDLSAYGETAKFGNGNVQLSFGMESTYGYIDARIQGTTSRNLVLNTSGGNVGIGTSSPGAKLDVVAGDIRLGTNATYFRVRDTASAQPRVLGMNSANTFYIGPIDSYAGGAMAYGVSGNVTYHGFYGGGGEKVRITSAGQVGVGLTAPQTALQLYGTADDTTVGGAHRTAIRLTSTYASTFGGGGELQFGLHPSIAGRDALSVIKGSYSAFSSGNYGGDLEFHTRDADGLGLKQRMTVAHDGNVGIGTTGPSYTLDVTGTGRFTGDMHLGRYIFHNGDTNTWMGFPTNDTISFRTNNSDRMYINSSGNVGVGTTNPQRKFHVNGIARIEANAQTLDLVGTDHTFIGFYPDGAAAGRKAYIGFPGATSNRLTIANEFNDDISFFTNGSEKVTIENSGDVGIGTTSPTSPLHIQKTLSGGQVMAYFDGTVGPSTYGALGVRVDNIDYGTGMRFYRSGIYDSGAIGFINGTSTVGSININTSSTSYNTTSDYRLKENLTEITDGIDRIKQLKPKRFNFIGDTSIVDGFIAHEAKQVVPEAVTGEKDEVLPNGDPVYQGIDQAKIVPLLTAALQEAITKIEVLENRLQILENK